MAAPKDGVHLQKYEDTASGGDDADQNGFSVTEPLEAWEDGAYLQGVILQAPSATPVDSATFDKLVYVSRDAGGNMVFRDDVDAVERTLTELIAGAGGLTETAHKALRQLIHFMDGPTDGFTSGMFSEVVGTVFPTSQIWYVAGSTPPAGKIVTLAITWTGVVPTLKVWEMYDTDGSTVLVTLTETISYTGIFETGRVRTWA